MIAIERICTALKARRHAPADFEPSPKHASVAMIMADGARELEVCFIRRAERAEDPWSGQVAFPGGRASALDSSADAVARRETSEEIGVELSDQHFVGDLPVRPNIRNGLTLSPFAYFVDDEQRQRASAKMPDEVASVFWVPISHLFDVDAVTQLEYELGGSSSKFPGIQFEDHIIWGLTLRVLQSFAEIIDVPFPALE